MESIPGRYGWHDFTRPGWYHITLQAANRGHNVFSRLQGAHNEPTAVGRLAAENWRHVGAASGGRIVTHSFQLMPDHLHILLAVIAPLPRPLGSYIGAFKAATAADCRKSLRGGGIAAGPRVPLWAPRFDWELKTSSDVIAAARQYIRENPAVALLKRAVRSAFPFTAEVSHPRLPGSIAWADAEGRERPVPLRWASFGNLRLLDGGRFAAVRVSRRASPAEIGALARRVAAESGRGLVPVSPTLSPGEKAVMAAALAAGGSAIIIEARPINRYYKPPADRLRACAEGHLLMLSPIRDDPRHPVVLSKQLAERLNMLAAAIAHGRRAGTLARPSDVGNTPMPT